MTEDETRPMVYDAHDKKTLVLSVRAAVEKLVTHFSTGGTQQERIRLGQSGMSVCVCDIERYMSMVQRYIKQDMVGAL